MEYGKDRETCSKEKIERRFTHFKDTYTFDNWPQAALAMDRFLTELRSDPQYATGYFLKLMEKQCMEAVEEAQGNMGLYRVPERHETWEWHIDPCGVALEHRAYDIRWVDELTVMASPSYRFPSDYALSVLASSKERDTIDFRAFRERTGLTAEDAYYLIRQFPLQAYTGRLSALSRLRISEGALYYYQEYGSLAMRHNSYLIWPRMYATKCGVKYI